MPTYTVVHGDTLPLVAEKLNHSGEWLALAAANIGLVPETDPPLSDEAKAALIAERMTPGAELDIPAEWIERGEREPLPGEPAADADQSKAEAAREAAEQFEQRKQERERRR